MRSVEAVAEVARSRFRSSVELPTAFFEANAGRISVACRDLARTFDRGQRLLVFGTGAQWSDALHVSVEFVHPVIVGKRALPALAVQGDLPSQIRTLGEPGDAALALHAGGDPGPLQAAVAVTCAMQIQTLALVGGDSAGWSADHLFAVPSDDPFLVQEVHETLCHVLWELVHVFLEHPGTLK